MPRRAIFAVAILALLLIPVALLVRGRAPGGARSLEGGASSAPPGWTDAPFAAGASGLPGDPTLSLTPVLQSWQDVRLLLRMFPATLASRGDSKFMRGHSSLLQEYRWPGRVLGLTGEEDDRLQREMYTIQAVDFALLKAAAWPFKTGKIQGAYFDRWIDEVSPPDDAAAVRAGLLAVLSGDTGQAAAHLPPAFRLSDIDVALRTRAALWLAALEPDQSTRLALQREMQASDPGLRAAAAAALLSHREEQAVRAWFAGEERNARTAFLAVLQPDTREARGDSWVPKSRLGVGWSLEIISAFSSPDASAEERSVAAAALTGQAVSVPYADRLLGDAVAGGQNPETIFAILHHYPTIRAHPAVRTSLMGLARGDDRRLSLAALSALGGQPDAEVFGLMLAHVESDDTHFARLAAYTIAQCAVETDGMRLALQALKRGTKKHQNDAFYLARARAASDALTRRLQP